jgi:heptosyltransferase-2
MDYFKPEDYSEEVFKNIKGPLIYPKGIKKIFVFVGKPGLGDLILSIPFFKALIQNFPNIKEIVYTGEIPEYLKNIFNLIPKTNLFYLPEYKIPKKSFKYWLRLWKTGILKTPDLAIDTQRIFIFSLFFRFFRAKYHLGYGSKCFFSNWKFKEKNRKSVHDTYQTLLLLRATGIKNIDTNPCLDIPDKFLKPSYDYIKNQGLIGKNIAAFFPGAGLSFKCWQEENFIELGKMLIKENYNVLLMGNTKEIQLLKKIKAIFFLFRVLKNLYFFLTRYILPDF